MTNKVVVKKVTTIEPSSKRMLFWRCSECNHENITRVDIGADEFIGRCGPCNAKCRVELEVKESA